MNLLEDIQDIRFPATLPDTLLAVHQTFDTPQVDDIHAAVGKALTESGIMRRCSRAIRSLSAPAAAASQISPASYAPPPITSRPPA